MIIDHVEGSVYRVHPHHERGVTFPNAPHEIRRIGVSCTFDARDVVSISVGELIVNTDAEPGVERTTIGYTVEVRLARGSIVTGGRDTDVVGCFAGESEFSSSGPYSTARWRVARHDGGDEIRVALEAATVAATEIEEIVMRHRAAA